MWCLRIGLLCAGLSAFVAVGVRADGEVNVRVDQRPLKHLQYKKITRTAGIAAAPNAASALVPAATADALLANQRADFKIAWAAAQHGDMVTLSPYLETLKDYPLYPYLRYAYLDAILDRAPDGLVEQFLQDDATLPVSDALRQDWVIAAAKRQEWPEVLAYYHNESGLGARCAFVSAHVLSGAADANHWTAAAQRLWLTAGTPRDVCQPLFDYLDAHDLITTDMRRTRVENALMSRDFVTAAALAPGLDEDDRSWAQLWIAVAANPAEMLQDILVPDEPRYQEMLQSGVKLLARTSPDKARHLWTDLSHHYHFSHDDARDMRTLLAMQQAWHLRPTALDALKGVHDAIDPQVPEWRARLALRAGDWREALKDIGGLGADQDDTEWRYWKARCLEALGQKTAAHRIYHELARTPDYYGFLSADRLHLDYHIVQEVSQPAADVIGQLALRPGFLRARELVYAGLYPLADAEWAAATRGLSTPARCQAALLADRWGWYGRVIPALAGGDCWQDLALIYPIAFEDTLAPQAKRLAIDLSWVYGLIRQESVFRPNAVSQVGALGLMQLMPATGHAVGERLGLTLDGPQALLDPETNLTLGSTYLSNLLHHFDGSEALATAAYNAGETRVSDWLPEHGALPADVWVDTIPYTETRNYVRRVMAHTVMFDWRLHGKPERLSQRLGEIGADADTAAVTDPGTAMAAARNNP